MLRERIRTGDWVDSSRLRVYPLIYLGVSLVIMVAAVALGHGQSAFLSAALLGWGLILLPRRPWLAGALMGVLLYKPQLGLLLPVALLAAGNRRALIGSGLSAVVLSALSYALFGAEVWAAFFAKSEYSRLVLEQGLVPWHKMISGFAAARMLGASVGLAWALQALVSLTAAAAVWQVWRGPAPQPAKAAALAAGTLLAAPLALDYDATLLGLALAALAAEGLRRGFLDWEISTLAAVWMMPLFWRPLAQTTDIPLGVVTVMLLFWLAVRRAWIAGRQTWPPGAVSGSNEHNQVGREPWLLLGSRPSRPARAPAPRFPTCRWP
ncbi:glycosyltransferase family 87 protein [uncultured Thiodictyon sp.]|jgi:hypothetical protein|uniref:glycosyltransferase family 87 protein n=1 Tax=uncultured Thiodictyon sp. TaxID=1846217 RepID=UPI0025FA0A46|nr:glycosyltransferase family 87 protein [uncultured Thiodictyon sp.]